MVGNEGWSIDPHRVSKATDELSRRVAIQADLTWHFGPGDKSEHRLTMCANVNAEVRPTAERCLREGPAADATWEYRSSQQADPRA